jgi:NAD(P)-dependent dehydrogenase (short-subunit alcohol dehydrogenase family)
MGKVAWEVIHLLATEVAEVEEPFAWGKVGSSTMPHKRNPTICELIVALTKIVRQDSATALDTMVQEHERDMGAWQAGWDWVLDVNLKGTFLTCHAALPYLTAAGRGRIVNISSDAGKKGWPLIAHYSASKFGVIGLTQSLAVEYGPQGVTVNAVCPSRAPETGMGQKVLGQKVALWGRRPEKILQSTAASIPLRRYATSADVADAVLFLISENAGYISGEALNVDGGQLSG